MTMMMIVLMIMRRRMRRRIIMNEKRETVIKKLKRVVKWFGECKDKSREADRKLYVSFIHLSYHVYISIYVNPIAYHVDCKIHERSIR